MLLIVYEGCSYHFLFLYARVTQLIDQRDDAEGFRAYLEGEGGDGLMHRLRKILPAWKAGTVTLVFACRSSQNRYNEGRIWWGCGDSFLSRYC